MTCIIITIIYYKTFVEKNYSFFIIIFIEIQYFYIIVKLNKEKHFCKPKHIKI